MFIPDLDFLPIADPGVKKAPDPVCGSATLGGGLEYCLFFIASVATVGFEVVPSKAKQCFFKAEFFYLILGLVSGIPSTGSRSSSSRTIAP
jgi:hypothetical protein